MWHRNGKGPAVDPTALRLKAAGVLMPHPDKYARGGEDAVYVAEDGLSFGKTRASLLLLAFCLGQQSVRVALDYLGTIWYMLICEAVSLFCSAIPWT